MDIRPIFTETALRDLSHDSEPYRLGWKSVGGIFLNPEALYTQPAGWLLTQLERNLELADNYDAPYRVHARRQNNGDDYWHARARRLAEIIHWIEERM